MQPGRVDKNEVDENNFRSVIHFYSLEFSAILILFWEFSVY